jgi:proteasome-associated ATPase
MDGLVSLQNVVVMLTSNRPDYIDPAVLRPERIDRRVKVGRPDRRASSDILKIYLNEQIPIDPALLAQHGADQQAAREELVERTLSYMFRRDEETRFLEVYLRNGSTEILHWRDLVSGALIKSAVERAKDFAIKRSIERNSGDEGLSIVDLERAVRVEYKENEIFPKSDAQEDWLKLLDYEPEDVVNVRPIRPERMAAAAASRRSII